MYFLVVSLCLSALNFVSTSASASNPSASSPSASSAHFDERYAPISKVDLIAALKVTPLSSEDNLVLIRQAENSGLSKFILAYYMSALTKSPQDVNLMTWAAEASSKCFWTEINPFFDGTASPGDAAHYDVDADRLFKEALRLKPNNEVTERLYGYFIGTLYDKAGAIKYLDACIKAAPGDAEAHLCKGIILMPGTMGVFSETAFAELSAAVKMNPNLATAHMYLMLNYHASGRKAEAKQELELFKGLLPPGAEKLKYVDATLHYLD